MMKRHKQLLLPLFAFSMLPIVLFQSASASADMVTVTITTLAITEIIRGFSRRITSSNVLFLGVLGGILALSKFPYSIVLLPALWLPKGNFAIKRQSLFLKLAITGSVLLSLIWVIIANHSFINLRAFVDTPEQLSFMLYHPISYGLIVFRTLFSTYGDTLLLQLSGILGWLDTKLPLWVTFASLFSLLLTIITAKLSPSKTMRWIFWSAIACTTLAIISLLYLTWCAPKAALVDGLQGRYFIPLIGLLIGAIGGSLPVSTRTYTRVRYWVICVGLITGLMTILTLVSRYY